MLLGALFLGIGGQASNIREIQTISMPVTLLQLLVFLLAMIAVGRRRAARSTWLAYVFPFSSPMAMIALAAADRSAVAALARAGLAGPLGVLIIRVSSRLFRRTVLKSGAERLLLRLGFWRKPAAE